MVDEGRPEEGLIVRSVPMRPWETAPSRALNRNSSSTEKHLNAKTQRRNPSKEETKWSSLAVTEEEQRSLRFPIRDCLSYANSTTANSTTASEEKRHKTAPRIHHRKHFTTKCYYDNTNNLFIIMSVLMYWSLKRNSTQCQTFLLRFFFQRLRIVY